MQIRIIKENKALRQKFNMKCIRGYFESYSEASLIVHAVRLGIIEPINERLSAVEREKIRSGCIFIFVEREKGIKRWTDGKIWSPSKILGHFLVYKEVPKHLSKSSLKKRNLNEKNQNKITQFKIEPSMIDDLCLHKKTISIRHETKTYHIIAYYQPIFMRHTINSFPFFRLLNNSLIENSNLLSDKFVEEELSRNVFILKKYRLLEFKGKNIIPEYDRRSLEDNAIFLLTTKFGTEFPINRDK